MKCNECTEYFHEYLNKELDRKITEEFSEHIKACGKCKEEYELYNAYFGLSKIEDDFSIPHNLDAKIIYKLNTLKEAKKPKFKFETKKFLTYATSLSFLFVIAFFGTDYIDKLSDFRDKTTIETTVTATPTPETLIHEPEPIGSQVEDNNVSVIDESEGTSVFTGKPAQTAVPERRNTPKPKAAPTANQKLSENKEEQAIMADNQEVQPAATAGQVFEDAPTPIPVEPAPTLAPRIFGTSSSGDSGSVYDVVGESPAESDIAVSHFVEPESAPGSKVSGGGGGGSVSMVPSPEKSVANNASAPKELKEPILKAYKNRNLEGNIYELDVSSKKISQDFPRVNIITPSEKVVIKFE